MKKKCIPGVHLKPDNRFWFTEHLCNVLPIFAWIDCNIYFVIPFLNRKTSSYYGLVYGFTYHRYRLKCVFKLISVSLFRLSGGAIIPCNIISNLISAWVVRRFKLTCRQCALLVIIALSVCAAILPVLMAVGCKNTDTAGITVPYNMYKTIEGGQLQNNSATFDGNSGWVLSSWKSPGQKSFRR